MQRFFRKHKRLAYGLIALFVTFAALIELSVGWDAVLIWAGLKASPVTVEGTVEVHFIDVGNADCILVRQGDQTMLIDAGERGDADAIIDYLSEYGVKRLNLVIATHPHADHIGSMDRVIEAFPIDKFVMSFMPESATPTTATYERMLTALDKKDVTVEEAVPGATYAVGQAQLKVLAPLEETDEINDISVVTKLVFGDTSFLLTGDAGTAVERQLMEKKTDLKADVLKLSHHGSSTGNSIFTLSGYTASPNPISTDTAILVLSRYAITETFTP